MNHSSDRYLRWAIVGVVVLAGWFVAFDVGGPFRSVVTMLALLVAPGLAASLVVGSMSADLRVVFATIVSAAIVMVVATAATLLGSKSVDIVFGIVGLVTISLLLVAGSKETFSSSDAR